jgi:hypothetical protein
VEEDLAEGYHEMDARELRKLSPVSSVCFEILEIIVVTFVLYTIYQCNLYYNVVANNFA